MTDTPPRKLSVEDKHPRCGGIVVAVNGLEQRFVISYDCDAGVVERFEVDENGQGVIKRPTFDEFATETVRGDVTAVYA